MLTALIGAVLLVAAMLSLTWLFEPGRRVLEEHVRALWWWRAERPVATGPWEAGFDHLTVPAGAEFGSFTAEIYYPVQAGPALGTQLRKLAWWVRNPTSASLALKAPIAASRKPYPLIVYFPSGYSLARESSFTLANLARHGFVVVALDDVIHLPLQPGGDQALQRSVLDTSSEEGFARTTAESGRRMDLEGRVGSLALDTIFASSKWGTLVDRDRIGVLGFSFGGGAAAAMSRHDPRVQAVVNLDGSLFGDAAQFGVDGAYLVLFAGNPVPDPAELIQPDLPARFEAIMNQVEVDRQRRDQARNGHWTFVVPRIEHIDFCDRLIVAAFNDQRGGKDLDRIAIWAAINRTLLAFFESPRDAEAAPVAEADLAQGLLKPLPP